MNTNVPSPFQDKPASMSWPMRLNWNGALVFAVIWIAVGVGGGSIWAHAGVKTQALSYQAALDALHAMPEAASLDGDPPQRKAALLKTGSVYDWRALVWLNTQEGRQPFIWRAHVNREKDSFRCTNTRLFPYTEELSARLSVHADEPEH